MKKFASSNLHNSVGVSKDKEDKEDVGWDPIRRKLWEDSKRTLAYTGGLAAGMGGAYLVTKYLEKDGEPRSKAMKAMMMAVPVSLVGAAYLRSLADRKDKESKNGNT